MLRKVARDASQTIPRPNGRHPLIFARVEVSHQHKQGGSNKSPISQCKQTAPPGSRSRYYPYTMKTPPARRIIHNKATSHSPATDYNDVVDRDGFGTPGPTRERIRNLEKQVQELVRKYQTEQVCLSHPPC